jgi:hypothetical protein
MEAGYPEAGLFDQSRVNLPSVAIAAFIVQFSK